MVGHWPLEAESQHTGPEHPDEAAVLTTLLQLDRRESFRQVRNLEPFQTSLKGLRVELLRLIQKFVFFLEIKLKKDH